MWQKDAQPQALCLLQRVVHRGYGLRPEEGRARRHKTIRIAVSARVPHLAAAHALVLHLLQIACELIQRDRAIDPVPVGPGSGAERRLLEGGDVQPLPGGDFPMEGAVALLAKLSRDYPFLEVQWAERIVRSYGTLARQWLGTAKSLDDLGPHFGHGLTRAEVDYLTAREWATSAEDVLWRRSKLGLLFEPAQAEALADYLGSQSAAVAK